MNTRSLSLACSFSFALFACSGASTPVDAQPANQSQPATPADALPFNVTEIATFDSPW